MTCLHDPTGADNQHAARLVFAGKGPESGDRTLAEYKTGPTLYVKWQHGESSMGGDLIQL